MRIRWTPAAAADLHSTSEYLKGDSERVRVNNRDVFVALEVVEVESQEPLHLVNAHRRNDPGIVDFDPRDSMLKHEFPPCRENFRRLGRIRRIVRKRSTYRAA